MLRSAVSITPGRPAHGGKAPRASFVVPCYNYGHFVNVAVDSLLEQTFQPIEVIVVDDASTDDTPERLERYRGDERVRVVRHAANRGHIATYNEGLAAARGEFIGLLSADDFCARPDAVARQVALFDRDADIGFVYSACFVADGAGRLQLQKRMWPQDYVRDGLEEFARLVFENYVPASGTLARRSAHEQVGYYDPRLPHAGDWDLWLRLAGRYRVGYVADALYAYRVHEVNMHHHRMRPVQTTEENVLTIRRAFEALPADAPARVRRLRRAATRNAWLFTIRSERAAGRVRRSWLSVLDLVRRHPRVLLSPAFQVAVGKVLALSVIGPERWPRLASWRKRWVSRLRGGTAVE
jgi:glycosyltransferase involved in cell wall biosynthesis